VRSHTSINLSERLTIDSIQYDSAEPNKAELIEEKSEKHMDSAKPMEAIYLEAEKVLDEARQRAEEILKKALIEATDIKQAAEDESYLIRQEALREQETLREQAREDARQIYDKIYSQAQDEKEQIINSIEGELADTLKTLLQYLIGEEVYQNTKWLLSIVKRMLSNDALKTDIKVFISPHVYDRLSDKEIEDLANIRDTVTLHRSEALSDTACRVESNEGAIEYDVKSGLDQVISDIKILQNLRQESL
jgi:flagellar assembly protein FliH